MMTHFCDLITQEAEAGGIFQTSLAYIAWPVSKINKNPNQEIEAKWGIVALVDNPNTLQVEAGKSGHLLLHSKLNYRSAWDIGSSVSKPQNQT